MIERSHGHSNQSNNTALVRQVLSQVLKIKAIFEMILIKCLVGKSFNLIHQIGPKGWALFPSAQEENAATRKGILKKVKYFRFVQ